jgi:hypothetical protein
MNKDGTLRKKKSNPADKNSRSSGDFFHSWSSDDGEINNNEELS